ncbi:two-component regulator [Rhodobacteraceae bacterium KLH11]|nr:two-component regulator [Rhodobacteraceae bacterium KLH11]
MRVLIYSHNRLFGECLKRGLSRERDVAWVAHAVDLSRVAELEEELLGASILVDLASADVSAVVEKVSLLVPDACFLALGVGEGDGDALIKCARIGFQGIVPVDTPLDELCGLIRAAQRGEMKLAPKAVAGLFRALHERLSDQAVIVPAEPEILTRREREVCTLVCEGLTNKEIARELNRSVGTVKNHIHAILGKLEVPRRGAIPSRFMEQWPDGAHPMAANGDRA